VNLDHYCCRCDSDLGWRSDRPDWCWVCNKRAIRLSGRIRALLGGGK